MSREIRRVPAHWEHPKNDNGNYQPMYDHGYLETLNDWWKNHTLWLAGKHPDQLSEKPEDKYKASDHKYWAEWEGDAPEVAYYRPDWRPEEMTWWQLYEGVSEGTPLTPAFATAEELIKHLTTVGDSWDKKPWTQHQAEQIVKGGYSPSLVVVDGKSYNSREALDLEPNPKKGDDE